nr:hypothetical protein [Tanacetum cinerariifolium]
MLLLVLTAKRSIKMWLLPMQTIDSSSLHFNAYALERRAVELGRRADALERRLQCLKNRAKKAFAMSK